MIHNSQKGVATLPTIIALAILILAIGVGITALSFSEIFITAGQNNALKALDYAEAGAKDALMRIARNKNYACASADCYSIDFLSNGCADNSGCARISVSAGVGSQAAPKIIVSKGQVNGNIRQTEVNVFYDVSLSGEIATTTWKEITD
ncbi:MAG: hypothetical protein AAB757_02930 [Patescibacteria group bacterium]